MTMLQPGGTASPFLMSVQNTSARRPWPRQGQASALTIRFELGGELAETRI